MFQNKIIRLRYVLISVSLLVLVFALFGRTQMKDGTIHQATGINQQINYQGRLLTNTGAVVPDGTYNVEFKIYQDGDGVLGGGDETLKWTETRTGSNKVTVKNGYFSVYLGSVTALGTSVDWNQDTLWLTTNIGGTGSPSWDGEMTPFTRFSSAPYAMNTKYLGGLSSTDYLQIAQGIQTDSSSTNSSISVNKTGGTADLIDLLRNGISVFRINNTGSALFKNQTDSSTGFQVQSTSLSDLFTVNTIANQVGIGGPPANSILTVGTNTTTASGGITLGTDVNLYRGGTNLLMTDDSLLVSTSNTINAFRVRDNSGNNVLQVSTATGNKSVNIGSTNAAGILKVIDESATPVFNVVSDSSNSYLDSTLASYSFMDELANPILGLDTAGVAVGGYGGDAVYKLDVFDGDINIESGQVYRIGGVAGQNTSCSSTQFLRAQVVSGGLTTNGTCASVTGAEITDGSIANADLANSSISFALGTSGTDANWSSSPVALGGTATLNLPDASASNRGLVTTGAQTFAGAKTFSSALSANGGITFDNSTDTVGAHTLSGNIDANNNLILNIGDAGTDFTSGGGLTLAGAFVANGTLTANGGTINLNSSGTNITSIGNTTGALTLTGSSGSTISFGGITLSSAELNLLDGRDGALVDTNDAVATAIIGTGALNAGSITSGFGSIDVGTDGITTTGTIGTAGSTTFTGGAATISDTVNLPGGATVTVFNCCGTSTWINMPTTGPSGIGTGGAGSNPWIAYVAGAGQWLTNSAVGDTAYRNTSGRLVFGTSSGDAQIILSTSGLTFDTPTTLNNSLTANGAVTLGDGGDAFSVSSTGVDITSAGAVSGVTTLTTTGNITSGGTFVGNGNSGSTISACSSNQYIGNGVRIDDGLITAGSCRTDATFSDARLKENIEQVASTLDKIGLVNVVSYDYKCKDEALQELYLTCDHQRGVIAQELEQLFPDLITTDKSGYKMVDTTGLGFYNLKATSELAKFINSKGEANLTSASIGLIKADSLQSLTAGENINIKGDVVIDGNLIAKKIKAEQIEGLDVLAGQIKRLASVSNTAQPNPGVTTPQPSTNSDVTEMGEGDSTTNPDDATMLKLSAQQVAVRLDLSVGGGLTVGGTSEFRGNTLFYKMVTFVEKTIFKNDVTFEGRVAFNNDTGGFALIKPGQSSVRVKFTRPYESLPVVTLSIKNGVFAQYSYKDLTADGFTIVLSQPATESTEFAWTALSINGAVTAQAN